MDRACERVRAHVGEDTGVLLFRTLRFLRLLLVGKWSPLRLCGYSLTRSRLSNGRLICLSAVCEDEESAAAAVLLTQCRSTLPNCTCPCVYVFFLHLPHAALFFPLPLLASISDYGSLTYLHFLYALQ